MSPGVERRTIILVSGYDYPQLSPHVRSSPDGVHRFTRIARNRCAQLLASRVPALGRGPLRVLLMDFPSGTVTSIEPHGADVLHEEVVASFRPITPDNYEWMSPGRWVFCKHAEGVMSILDVYDVVQDIAEQEPRSLLELSFLAHAWAGGPTFVNSDDTIDRDPTHESRDDDPRDAIDKDGRRFKDFRAPTTDADDLELLQRAFAEDGYVWNWGCNNSLASACVLQQAIRNDPSPIDKELVGEASLTFRFDHDDQESYFSVDDGFFPAPTLEPGGSVTFERSIDETVSFLAGRIRATYNAHAATAFGVRCFGALPGTSSDFERCVPFPQMEVPNGAGYAENFAAHLRFYERYLRTSFDPEGRGFGAYHPEPTSAT